MGGLYPTFPTRRVCVEVDRHGLRSLIALGGPGTGHGGARRPRTTFRAGRVSLPLPGFSEGAWEAAIVSTVLVGHQRLSKAGTPVTW